MHTTHHINRAYVSRSPMNKFKHAKGMYHDFAISSCIRTSVRTYTYAMKISSLLAKLQARKNKVLLVLYMYCVPSSNISISPLALRCVRACIVFVSIVYVSTRTDTSTA